MSKINDIITLAKAGYKASEIAQLLTEASKGDEGAEKPAEIEPKEATQPEPEKANEQPPEPDAEDKDKIAQLQKQIDELTQRLSEAQAANSRKDNSDKKSEDPQETLNKIAQKFM